MFNWFRQTFFSWQSVNQKGKIIILGLNDAGKTTLLSRLKDQMKNHQNHPPTSNYHEQTLVLGKTELIIIDLDGHQNSRQTWKNYVDNINGIIYVVDISKPQRFEESAHELANLLEMPKLSKIPIAILGNKIDKINAVSQQHLRKALKLPKQDESKDKFDKPIKIFVCSLAHRVGHKDAINWICTFLK